LIQIDDLPAVDSEVTVKTSDDEFFLVKWDLNSNTPPEKILKLPFTDLTKKEDEERKMHDDPDLNTRKRR